MEGLGKQTFELLMLISPEGKLLEEKKAKKSESDTDDDKIKNTQKICK